MNNPWHSFFKIAGVCSILAPLTMLGADIMFIAAGLMFEWTLVLWLAFVLFVPAIFGLTFILYESGSRLALVGGLSAFFGAMAGAGMQVLFRVYAVLAEHGAEQTIEALRGTGKLVASTQMIGIFYPIGLILLALSLYRSRIVSPLISLALVLGAVFFPVGRIAGSQAAVLASGAFLTVAFGVIGWRMLSGRGFRTASPNADQAKV